MVKIKSLAKSYINEQFWLAGSTKETTKRAFDYLALAVGNLSIDRLNYSHCESYKSWLVKSGRSKTTANIYMRSLRPVFNWAVRLKLLGSNPMVELTAFKTTQKPIRVYEDWEFERMLRFCQTPEWKFILLVARTTGLRRGEVLNLHKDNFRSGFVFVEPKRNTERTWEWEPKDKEIRKVPCPDYVYHLAKDAPCYYPSLTVRRYATQLRLKGMGMLVESRRKCPHLNFRRDFVKIQRKAFGRQIGDFHSLRKTYITEMASEFPDYFVMKLSGHSNTRTMVTYYTACRDSQFISARKIASEVVKKACSPQAYTPKTKQINDLVMGDARFELTTSCV